MSPSAPGSQRHGERFKRSCKSSWWAEVFSRVGPPPSGCRWIYTADRESDFYEPYRFEKGGRRGEFEKRMEPRRAAEDGKEFKGIVRGCCLASEAFRKL